MEAHKQWPLKLAFNLNNFTKIPTQVTIKRKIKVRSSTCRIMVVTSNRIIIQAMEMAEDKINSIINQVTAHNIQARSQHQMTNHLT